jgi:amidase
VPGGSSGGTAAAVAASFGAIGLGSDTCGSIRIPSAFNNLIGLRPSKGFSSIYGVMPLSHTQDVAGPLARSAEDLAIVLDAVGGFDSNDEATAIMQNRELPRFRQSLGSIEPQNLRLGKLSSYFERSANANRSVVEQALQWYQQQGAEIIEVEIPELDQLIARSGLIGHEFRTDLNQYLSLFSSQDTLNLNDIVDLGLYQQAVEPALTRSRESVFNEQAYRAAVLARVEVREAVEMLLTEHNLDAIVYPPIGELPVFIGEPQPGNNCQISANSGLPALSMPVGFSSNGLPVGMELLGRQFDDARLLAIAYAFEQANKPRQAPSVTPALIAGAAPPPIHVDLTFDVAGVVIEGDVEFDIVSNQLRYDLALTDDNTAEVYAVTLMVDREEGFRLNDPIVVTLLGPDMEAASDSYFMSASFRQAFLEQRVYLKVFGSTLFSSGVTQRLR